VPLILKKITDAVASYYHFTATAIRYFGVSAVAILELKKLGGPLRGQGKRRGANINVYLAWGFSLF